ncbi:hypothetical protein K2X85_15605 [bacterium]|nr:hypothetical protein [bacterium]
MSANVISASSDASATAQALGRALATSTTSNLTTGALIGVPLAGMSLAGAGSSSTLASGSASASGSLDADPNFPGSRDVDQDPSFVGRRPDLDPMTPQTPDDLDPAEVDRLATNYSLFPDQTGLPGEELKDPRQRAEEMLRYQARAEAAQQQRFQQMIDEHNQLFAHRPERAGSGYGTTGMDASLDALGTADPTGLVDGYHAVTYAVRGEWGNAGLTAVGVIPIVGDAFKLAKYGRLVDEAVGGVVDVYARFGPDLVHQSDAFAVSAPRTAVTRSVGSLQDAGLKDAHHVIQDAAVRDLPGYNYFEAPGIQLPGPSNVRGTPHYSATLVQRQSGGGTYAAERRIGYKALRRAGVSPEDARQAIAEADNYFYGLGVRADTPTRIPGNR